MAWMEDRGGRAYSARPRPRPSPMATVNARLFEGEGLGEGLPSRYFDGECRRPPKMTRLRRDSFSLLLRCALHPVAPLARCVLRSPVPVGSQARSPADPLALGRSRRARCLCTTGTGQDAINIE